MDLGEEAGWRLVKMSLVAKHSLGKFIDQYKFAQFNVIVSNQWNSREMSPNLLTEHIQENQITIPLSTLTPCKIQTLFF